MESRIGSRHSGTRGSGVYAGVGSPCGHVMGYQYAKCEMVMYKIDFNLVDIRIGRSAS